MVSPEVIVVGGGLAGIAAALRLKEGGRRVLLLERAQSLGGRAGSTRGRDGVELDAGQHVYLGCCTNFLRLLRELGAEHLAPLAKRLDLAIVDPGPAPGNETRMKAGEGPGGEPAEHPNRPREAFLKAAPLPYPLSLAGALLAYEHLDLSDRLSALRIAARAAWEYRSPRMRRALDGCTFEAWLTARGASPRSVERLWEPLSVAALNASPSSAGALAGAMVIAKGLAGGPRSAALGVFRAPMAKLFESVERRLAPLGEVRLGRAARSVLVEGGRARGVALENGAEIRSECVVVAASHVHVPALLPGGLAADPFFARLKELATRPIVNVHLWYDRPVASRPVTCVLRSPLQWIFDLSELYGEPCDGTTRDATGREATGRQVIGRQARHYCISVSDAPAEMATPREDLVRAMDREVRRAFPAARGARLLGSAVRKMRHATFTCAPGSAALRPANETPVAGLYLAGDYTDTGWPSTMESAVISGRRAAELVLARFRL